MPPTVHILATCKNPELWRATTLVFESLRTGFPTAPIVVDWNAIPPEHAITPRLFDACTSVEAKSTVLDNEVLHPDWIDYLIETEHHPFFICDTDMVFWKSFEGFDFTGAPMAGRFVPQFFDPWTRCLTRPRLHTCLLYLDPVRIRKARAAYFERFPRSPFCPLPNLVKASVIPWRTGRQELSYFHDSCCLLYQAIGGQPFTTEQLDCFDHLQSGTLSDDVGKAVRGLRPTHFAVFENPSLLRGAWRMDDRFYALHATP